MEFTDREEKQFADEGYVCDKSRLGMVYYKDSIIEITGPIAVNYMEYPWMSYFEVEGMRLCRSGRRVKGKSEETT